MPETAPHELTEEEVGARFLALVREYVNYWERKVKPETPLRERLEGLAFSILVILDGEAVAIPGFVVAPRPHPDDRAYYEANGESWYPERPEVACDIAGSLHEELWSGRDG